MQRRHFLIGSALLTAGVATGCTTTPQTAEGTAAKKKEINSGIDSTLSRLYTSSKGSRELVQKARGVLVFPSVLSAGLIVGGEYGEGALRVGGQTTDYYKTTSGSFGWQAGAQSRALIFLFMTDDALKGFRASDGFTIGANASVALLKIGANGSVDTNTVKEPIIGFALTNSGLMAGLTLEGTKITKLKW